MSIIATSPSWNAGEMASRSPNSRDRPFQDASGSSPSNWTDSSPASRSSSSSTSLMPPPPLSVGSSPARARPGAPSCVVAHAVAERAEALTAARAARSHPSRRPVTVVVRGPRPGPGGTPAGADRRVGARGRRAAAGRTPGGARLPRSRTVVPWKPMSPTQWWAQACGQPSRLQASAPRAASPKRASRCSDEGVRAATSSRRRRSCSAARRCMRSPRTASGLPASGSPSSASRSPIRSTSLVRDRRRGRGSAAASRAASPPELPDELRERDHLLAGDQAQTCTGTPSVEEAVLLLRLRRPCDRSAGGAAARERSPAGHAESLARPRRACPRARSRRP